VKALSPYRIRARNHAAESPNKMHDPEYARSLGFAGGIVPGVDVYAYLTRPVVDFWGMDWLFGGGMDVRFLKPVYDEELLTIEAAADGEVQLQLEAKKEDGAVCATALALLRPTVTVPRLDAYESRPLPAKPPPAEEANFQARPVLGSLDITVSAEDSARQLAEVEEQLDVYARERIVHPGHLLRFADRILLENFSLPPWMHVSSSLRHFALARVGEPLSVRANLVDLFERKGHRFVQLDVLVQGPAGPVARVMPYTAIYRPAFS
jgi:acyl dehydratase